MHGIIFTEMKQYVKSRDDLPPWSDVIDAAGHGSSSYLAIKTYPDEDLLDIVETASEVTGEPVPAIVEDFGQFVAPDLLEKYGVYIQEEWDVMDLLAETEATIHNAVRLHVEDADPPELECHRNGNGVVIEYRSELGLCKLGEGLIRGIADHYGESLEISQDQCMLEGGSACEIEVARA